MVAIVMLQLITILFNLKTYQVTLLTLSISYLHLRENLKREVQLTDN